MNLGSKDQMEAAVREIAILYGTLFHELRRAGFTKKQAFELVVIQAEKNT